MEHLPIYLVYEARLCELVFFIKAFVLDITIQLDISARQMIVVTWPQVTTIIYHHMKKILLKKEKKYGGTKQNTYVNKNDT